MAMSKEEKKAKKEAKKLAKLLAEAEARKELKREELKREIKAQATKRTDLERTWREMMLKVKEPVFRRDIEVMWQTFERTYDKKDHLVKYTMHLMDVADDQVQRTVASFCDTVDTMINKFLSDLEEMSKDNNRRTAALLKLGEDDAAQIMADHNAAETHLQLLIYHAHTTADTEAWCTRGENLVKQDEEQIKYADERENLCSFLENIYNTMWEEYKTVLRSYVNETSSNQKQVRRLRRKENMMADIIASQGKRIASSDGVLKNLRNELAQYESGTKQAVFRDRRNRHRAACKRLKQDLVKGCAHDDQQLARLVRNSDDTLEWLEKAHKKGEKILRLAALCRRFETQREKVLPYGSEIPHPPIQIEKKVRKVQSDDSLVVNAVSSTSGLNRLWQKIAKAELSRRALLREKMILEQENLAILRTVENYGGGETGLKAKTCICNRTTKNNTITKPVAIDGCLALKFYLPK